MCITLIFWRDFFWGQVAVSLGISVGLVIFMGWFRPLDTSFANNMEMFNEIITLCALYLMMCFSDFVGDPETRSLCGIAFIFVICLYAANHILFLLINVCMQVRHLIRSKYYAYRNQKMLATMKAVRSRTLMKDPQSQNTTGRVEAKSGK